MCTSYNMAVVSEKFGLIEYSVTVDRACIVSSDLLEI